jgi:hypothetical protein
MAQVGDDVVLTISADQSIVFWDQTIADFQAAPDGWVIL